MLKAQVARLKKQKMKAYCASELEFYLFDESYEAIHAKRYHEPKIAGYDIEDYHILQTTKEEGVMCAIRKGLQGEAFRSRTQRRVGPGAGGDQRPLFRCARDGRQPCDPEERQRRKSRTAGRQGRHLHVEWNYGLAGSLSHVHVSRRDAAGKTPLF